MLTFARRPLHAGTHGHHQRGARHGAPRVPGNHGGGSLRQRARWVDNVAGCAVAAPHHQHMYLLPFVCASKNRQTPPIPAPSDLRHPAITYSSSTHSTCNPGPDSLPPSLHHSLPPAAPARPPSSSGRPPSAYGRPASALLRTSVTLMPGGVRPGTASMRPGTGGTARPGTAGGSWAAAADPSRCQARSCALSSVAAVYTRACFRASSGSIVRGEGGA